MKQKKNNNSTMHRLYRKGIQLMLVGIITGMVVGVIVTFFNIAADIIMEYSSNVYLAIRENPWFIPLLFVVLAAASLLVGTIIYFVPMISGSGIPQTEGASRGLLEMKWYKVLPAMLAASLFSLFMGVLGGAEGPSVFVGGQCGTAVNKLLSGTDMEKRYQITGGACAGLAVAFNAPLTGIVFAFEEAHRRFTPSIFICAFSSVLSGLVTRNLILTALNIPVAATFSSFVFTEMPIKTYGFVLIAAVLSGLLGVGFYKFGFLFRKLFAKMTALKGILRMLVPFLLAGVFGLITVYAIGGGRGLVESLGTLGGTRDITLANSFNIHIIAMLVIILIIRVIGTAVNFGAGVPVGIFIPMLTIGSLMGAVVAKVMALLGMNPAYIDCIILISMATFFTAVVKSPLTAIIMVVELTSQYVLLIPVILGVAVGYMISEIFNLKPLYDVALEDIMQLNNVKLERKTYVTKIEHGSVASGQAIRDVLWPGNMLIRSIKRDGTAIVPSSDTVLNVGDEISVQAETASIETLQNGVNEIVKPRVSLIAKIKNFFLNLKRHKDEKLVGSKNETKLCDSPDNADTIQCDGISKTADDNQSCGIYKNADITQPDVISENNETLISAQNDDVDTSVKSDEPTVPPTENQNSEN